MTPDDERHGTYAGVQAHRRARVSLCDPCKKAESEYMKAWRAANPHHKGSEAARKRAMHRLAALHHDEYMRLYAAECRDVYDLPRPDAEYVR